MTDNNNLIQEVDETVVQRAEEYGPPTENYAKIADLWEAYLGVEITPYDYAQLMQLAKIGRSKTGTPERDTEKDKMGYAYTGHMVREDAELPAVRREDRT